MSKIEYKATKQEPAIEKAPYYQVHKDAAKEQFVVMLETTTGFWFWKKKTYKRYIGHHLAPPGGDWFDTETGKCVFADEQLKNYLRNISIALRSKLILNLPNIQDAWNSKADTNVNGPTISASYETNEGQEEK